MFTSDLNAGVVPQMSPPLHDLERLRTTMVDFIVLSIKLVFMVLGVSYSRVLAQRPTGCCSASFSKYCGLYSTSTSHMEKAKSNTHGQAKYHDDGRFTCTHNLIGI